MTIRPLRQSPKGSIAEQRPGHWVVVATNSDDDRQWIGRVVPDSELPLWTPLYPVLDAARVDGESQ